MGIIISHDKDPYLTTSIMESNNVFVAQMRSVDFGLSKHQAAPRKVVSAPMPTSSAYDCPTGPRSCG